MAFPGFNRAKRSTISSGDFDGDGVSNRRDCQPMNWKKQDNNFYKAFWKGREIEVSANSSYEAQQKAQKIFGAKKGYDVSIVLIKVGDRDIVHSGEEF